MGWMDTLSKTYDECSKAVADEKYGTMLMPVSHLTAEAQITITIDCGGNFVGADKIDKGQGTTIVPVTEDSATRSSGISPNPLCDKLVYIAKDYGCYVRDDKKNFTEYYEAYISQLKKWAESEYSTQKVTAIYNYVSKGEVIKDLINSHVLTCGADGLLDKKVKIGTISQDSWFVRFIVLNPNENRYIPETWRDKELFDNFIKFNDTLMEKRNICYISGEYDKISVKHPAKIRNTGDKSKLISSNNDKSYLFGRLLAVADVIEERTYSDIEKRSRVTNARRYWSVFAKRPASTWLTIISNLQPYFDKEGVSHQKNYYNNLLGDIHYKLKECGGDNNNELTYEYVFGYWCQRKDMYSKNKDKEEN